MIQPETPASRALRSDMSWLYGILFVACMIVASACAVSLIADYVQLQMKQTDNDRRQEMEKIVKEMIQQWKDSQK